MPHQSSIAVVMILLRIQNATPSLQCKLDYKWLKHRSNHDLLVIQYANILNGGHSIVNANNGRFTYSKSKI